MDTPSLRTSSDRKPLEQVDFNHDTVRLTKSWVRLIIDGIEKFDPFRDEEYMEIKYKVLKWW